jgi:hypothetical protein
MREYVRRLVRARGEEGDAEVEGVPDMLEGMKVLFDESVGLYPVRLVAAPEGEWKQPDANRR